MGDDALETRKAALLRKVGSDVHFAIAKSGGGSENYSVWYFKEIISRLLDRLSGDWYPDRMNADVFIKLVKEPIENEFPDPHDQFDVYTQLLDRYIVAFKDMVTPPGMRRAPTS